MKGSIVTFGLVGALALALPTATSLAASYTGNSDLEAQSSPLTLVRGGGGGGHGGMGGGGFGGGHVGAMGGSFGGGHVGSMGGHVGRMTGSHGFDGGHFHHFRHHVRPRFFSGYDDYGCYWSGRYHRWVCPYS
jgi:hypothetical protein